MDWNKINQLICVDFKSDLDSWHQIILFDNQACVQHQVNLHLDDSGILKFKVRRNWLKLKAFLLSIWLVYHHIYDLYIQAHLSAWYNWQTLCQDRILRP